MYEVINTVMTKKQLAAPATATRVSLFMEVGLPLLFDIDDGSLFIFKPHVTDIPLESLPSIHLTLSTIKQAMQTYLLNQAHCPCK